MTKVVSIIVLIIQVIMLIWQIMHSNSIVKIYNFLNDMTKGQFKYYGKTKYL
jgi:hypothetical protein